MKTKLETLTEIESFITSARVAAIASEECFHDKELNKAFNALVYALKYKKLVAVLETMTFEEVKGAYDRETDRLWGTNDDGERKEIQIFRDAATEVLGKKAVEYLKAKALKKESN